MKTLFAAVTSSMAILLVTTSSYGAESRRVLAKSSWLQGEVGDRSHQELYALAYTLEYLLQAQEVATQLSIDLAQSGKSEEINQKLNTEKRVSEIGGALSEVVIDAYNRTLPLLRLHPDKVVTQELIRHAIRYNGGVNEGWQALIENLCVINGDWTIELLKKLPIKDHEDLRMAIIDPNGRDESGLDETVLSLIAKAEESRPAGAAQPTTKPADVAEQRKFKKDFVIYEATVKGKKITVFLSESPFEPDKHKVTPETVVGKGNDARAIWPKVDGHEAAGFRESDTSIMKGIPHLTRLAVSFDGHMVEAPKELIAHVFMPHTNTTFDGGMRNGMISISSDTKAVVVDLAVGDAAWSGHEAFTFSVTGTCRLGVPIPPEP